MLTWLHHGAAQIPGRKAALSSPEDGKTPPRRGLFPQFREESRKGFRKKQPSPKSPSLPEWEGASSRRGTGVVGAEGLEPPTYGLKIRSSTN